MPSWLRWAPQLHHRVEPLDAGAAPLLAGLHAAAFAGPWEEHEFERLLTERIVHAHGVYVEAALPTWGWAGPGLAGGAFLRGFLEGFLGTGREPLGFVLSRAVEDEAEILTLALHPDVRGRGLAAPLLRRHLDDLMRLGVRAVHLEVEEGNAPALRLYQRHGFNEVGRRPGYYAGPGGTRATALVLTARL